MARDQQTGPNEHPGARRKPGSGRPFHHAAATARKAVTRVAGGKGFAETDVLLRWAEIVGADLAPRCRPVKVTYAGKKALGATLVVHTDSGRAPEVEHLGPAIVERVNQFYGYRAVSRLRVTQSSLRTPGFAEGQAAFVGPGQGAASPTAADARKAQDMTAGIHSPGLRAALSRMGANVLARARDGHISPKPDD